MQIVRDGKTYELTFQELIQAVHEVAAMEKAWKEEDDTARGLGFDSKADNAAWKAFLAECCKDLPFPKNLIIEGIYARNISKCKEFLASAPEEQEAFETMVVKYLELIKDNNQKKAIFLWYRDKMKIGDVAASIGCGKTYAYTLRDLGVMVLQYKVKKEEDIAYRELVASTDPKEVPIPQVRYLSQKTKRLLENAGIMTLAQFSAMTRAGILSIPGMALQIRDCESDILREMEVCAEMYQLDAVFMHVEADEEAPDDYIPYVFPHSISDPLWKHGIETIEELLKYSEEDLLKIKGIGYEKIKEIAQALTKNGYDSSHLMFIEKNITRETHIDDLGLSTHARNCLVLRANILTVGDFLGKTKDELMAVRGMGFKTFRSIVDTIGNAGFDVSHLS